jgi:hypothetical protein
MSNCKPTPQRDHQTDFNEGRFTIGIDPDQELGDQSVKSEGEHLIEPDLALPKEKFQQVFLRNREDPMSER